MRVIKICCNLFTMNYYKIFYQKFEREIKLNLHFIIQQIIISE